MAHASNQDTVLFLKATAAMYKDCVVNSFNAVVTNWVILPGIIASVMLFLFVATLVAPLGMLGGFIIGMLGCYLLSQYYSWLARSLSKERISFKSLIEFNYGIFSATLSAAFMLWIIHWLIGGMGQGIQGAGLYIAMFNLGIFLLLNPLPEVAYIRGDQDLSALQSAFTFVKNNWIEWFAPALLIFAIVIGMQTDDILQVFAASNPLYPFYPVFSGLLQTGKITDYGSLAFALVFCHWLMLFRAELFQALETGSRRARIYKWKNS